jgi:glycosyltransferase involved in cell wall biosynthesis
MRAINTAQYSQPVPTATSPPQDSAVRIGALDGITIMRYAHIHRRRVSGGVEQYLRLLDRDLLQRHRITVLQMHLVTDESDYSIETEDVGRGRILWVPVPIRQAESRLADLPRRMAALYQQALRRSTSQKTEPTQAIWSALRTLVRHRGAHLRYKTAVFSDNFCNLFATEKIDLLALHWGTYDTDALVVRALDSKVPFVFINHFDNRRLSSPFAPNWLGRAAATGVVSNRGIPDALRHRCVNLSDAVDTEFFAPEQVRSSTASLRPIILLPGRIDVGKGHRDMIGAVRLLTNKKFDVDLYFPGAIDAEPLQQELRACAIEMGLEARVHFLGEKTPEQLRELYKRSCVVVLPSSSEGLGRVLLEAQAMKKPVVAYDCGGMSEAFIPNETGFLVKTGEIEDLADKVGFLLNSESERVRFGECGREFVLRRFSVATLVQRHESFYLNALSSSSAQ